MLANKNKAVHCLFVSSQRIITNVNNILVKYKLTFTKINKCCISAVHY